MVVRRHRVVVSEAAQSRRQPSAVSPHSAVSLSKAVRRSGGEREAIGRGAARGWAQALSRR